MIDFDAVIRHFGPVAVSVLNGELQYDKSTFDALNNRSLPTRRGDVRNWLRSYGVLRVRGIGPRHDGIMDAILAWADQRDPQRDLTTVDALATAHSELMAAVCEAYDQQRDFTSLASKMLWLCYPDSDSVPLLDSYATRTLWVVSKFEVGIDPLPRTYPTYHQFVHVWKALYAAHRTAMEDLNLGNYPYRVRVFDRILWLIGKPQYGSS